MKILFIGDIVGKIGRQAVVKILPNLKAELQPDLVIANAENLAHGTGITEKTLKEVQAAGIDFFTSGNHVFDKTEAVELLNIENPVLIRPANMDEKQPGQGYKVFEVGSRKIAVINLIGQVFNDRGYGNPFKKADEILEKNDLKQASAIIVDFHAEATSEKHAMALYLDGRVSAVLGTHTHVPTADARVSEKGTARVTDVGMVGAQDSVIGNSKESIVADFVNGTQNRKDIPESGLVEFGAVMLDIDLDSKKASNIARVDRKIEV